MNDPDVLIEKSFKIRSPESFSELFNEWNMTPESVLYASGSHWIQNQDGRLFRFPPSLLSIEDLKELRKIDRTERYLEVGAMVTLNRIAALGKIVPEALLHSLRSTSSYLLRNIMTIGSCIYKRNTPDPVIAALSALDARYELRSARDTRRLSAAQFLKINDDEKLKAHECLLRVQIPLESWDYTLCRDFSDKENGDKGNEFAVFLAHIQKNILSEMRIIFSGASILRSRDSELTLIGKKLPLDKKAIQNFMDLWRIHLDSVQDRSEFQKSKLINFIGSAIHYFAH